MECRYKTRVLDYLRGDLEDPEIEKHIENCPECSALVEGYLAREKELYIPDTVYDGGDQKLKEQVVHYEKGTRRILIFTLVGLIMGWFSITYYTDSFLITKIILAVPYKISEALYGLLHEVPYLYTRQNGIFDAYFPQNQLYTFLAERITPVLTGGAVYGSLAYFTGDSRVFTLKRYLKFAAVWCALILGYAGIIIGLNHCGVVKNNRMEDISSYFLQSEWRGIAFDKEGEIGSQLDAAFYEDGMPKKRKGVTREIDGEIQMNLYLGRFRHGFMITYVNPSERYLVTDQGEIYGISERFARYVQKFWDDQFEPVWEEYERTGEANLDG